MDNRNELNGTLRQLRWVAVGLIVLAPVVALAGGGAPVAGALLALGLALLVAASYWLGRYT